MFALKQIITAILRQYFKIGPQKNLQFWIYHGDSHFLQIHEIKMGGHHVRFGAIRVQWYGKGEYSLQNACLQGARTKSVR